MAVHPHGDVNRYRHGGCRCGRCRAAHGLDVNLYRLAIATGTHRPDVDARPVRRHVGKLRADGLGMLRIAQLAGVSFETVRALMYGKQSRSQGATKRMRPETAARLLSVRVGSLPPDGWVPAAGTRRRVQALAVRGWPLPTLATYCDVPIDTWQRLTRCPEGARVTVSTARQVADVFKRLSRVEPSTSGVPAHTAARMRTLAVGKGWVSSAAWDDIDDPSERPKGLRREAS